MTIELSVNCNTGETATAPVPADVNAQTVLALRALNEQRTAAEAARERLLVVIRDHAEQDPAYAALAQLAGVLPMPGV